MKLFKLSLLSAALFALTACTDSDDTDDLVKGVKLESQRENGLLIESIEFEGAGVRLKKGETLQLIAWGKDTEGKVRDITKEVTWSSSNENAASISKNGGKVTALQELTENQGLVEFTATTINDVSAVAKVSISGVKATDLALVELDDADTEVMMCVDTQLAAKVTYEDGYVSTANSHNLTWSIENSDNAKVTETGVLSTFGEATQNVNVKAVHSDNVTKEQMFKASTSALSSVQLKKGDDSVTQLQMDLAERTSLTAELTLTDDTKVDITSSAVWQSENATVAAVSDQDEVKGNLVALTVGTVDISASCGGVSDSAGIAVTGNSTLDGLKINSDIDKVSLSPEETIELTLYADLAGLEEDFNVSEFAQWNLGDTDLATGQIKNVGKNTAVFELTAAKGVAPGKFNLIAFYQGQSVAIEVTVTAS